jgi:ADP-ribose pyrophosphatase
MNDHLAPWSVLASRRALAALPWLAVDVLTCRTPSGKSVEMVTRQSRDSVVVVAVDERGYCPMVRQRKLMAGRVLLEFPAGYLEPGELPLTAAQRELREETGFTAAEWTPLGFLYNEPHVTPAGRHYFLARGLTWEGDPAPDATEELMAARVNAQTLPDMVRDGELESAACIAAWALAAPYLKEHMPGGY